MKWKIKVILLIICLGFKINSRTQNVEVESIYKKPCDINDNNNCLQPYLNCEKVGDEAICERKGFFPMEGTFIILRFLPDKLF